VHQRYRRQTDRRQTTEDRLTDGRTTIYSEHEHEFTFAKKAAMLFMAHSRYVEFLLTLDVNNQQWLWVLDCIIWSEFILILVKASKGMPTFPRRWSALPLLYWENVKTSTLTFNGSNFLNMPRASGHLPLSSRTYVVLLYSVTLLSVEIKIQNWTQFKLDRMHNLASIYTAGRRNPELIMVQVRAVID